MVTRRALGAAATTALILVSSPGIAQNNPCPFGKDQFGNCRDEPPEKVAATLNPVTEIFSDPPGAEVRENGVPLGITPLKLFQKALKPGDKALAPGTHELTFLLPGFEKKTEKVFIDKGVSKPVPTVKLVPWPLLNVVADASAEGALFYLDQVLRGKLPIEPLRVEPGLHTIKIVKEGYEDWKREVMYASGSAPQPERVSLTQAKGTLRITTTLEGLPVFLGTADASGQNISLGATPVSGVPLQSGTRVIVFRPERGTEVAQIVVVQENKEVTLPFFTPYRHKREDLHSGYEPSEYSDDLVEKAKEACARGDGEACITAAHRLIHHAKAGAPPEDATELYEKGCKSNHAWSCYALGYLQRKKSEAQADQSRNRAPASSAGRRTNDSLKKACNLGLEDACWFQYDRLEAMDPTLRVGLWDSPQVLPFVSSNDESSIDFGPLVGVGMFDQPTFYAELQVGGRLLGLPWASFRFNLALRFRVIEQLDDTAGTSEWKVHAGPGLDMGVTFRPFKNDDLTLTLVLRMTSYFLNQSSLAPYFGVGHAFGRHFLEIGALLDTVPLHTESVHAFGETRRTEDQLFRGLAVLRYAILREP